MASEVDICNLALSHVGDEANITSLDEASAQAQHCKRFYPIARDALLALGNWSFSTTRANLALMAEVPLIGWQYAYAQPSLCVNILGIYAQGATSDESVVEFDRETAADGAIVILCNQQDAVIRYTRTITDTTLFPSLFVEALGWMLAASLAGPMLKGEAGVQMASAALKEAQYWIGRAREYDASQRRRRPEHVPPWMSDRSFSSDLIGDR